MEIIERFCFSSQSVPFTVSKRIVVKEFFFFFNYLQNQLDSTKDTIRCAIGKERERRGKSPEKKRGTP